MARQLTLDLPVSPGLSREDFLVGASNEHAVATVEAWPDWPDRLLVLTGPAGSGKSHLAAIWAGLSGAATVAAADVSRAAIPELADLPSLALEDLGGSALDEGALFHLVNLARERGHSLMLTADRPVPALGLRTPDLLSRLRLAPSVALDPPDEALLKAVLVKLLHDRQLTVDASVVDYVAARIERSLAAAARIVADLDREALSRGRRITRPIAAMVLAQNGAAPDEGLPDFHHPVASRP